MSTTRRLLLVSLAWPLALAACDGTEGPGETTGVCPESCDDGLHCTDDRCDTATGECIHVPRDVANACRNDEHCDDGDPCTSDACEFDVAGGCPELQRCVHVRLPSCRSCPSFPSQCDDGSACTSDTCGSDFLCRYTTVEHCDARCNSFIASSPDFTPVGAAQVRGMAETTRGGFCDDGACGCSDDLVLANGPSIRLAGLDEPWSCELTDACASPTVDCTPLEHRRWYVVYGDASNPARPQAIPARADAGGAPRADTAGPREDVSEPPPQASLLDVEGYCLALEPGGIDGTYDATLVLDDEAQAATFRVTISSMQPTITNFERLQPTGGSMWSQDGVSAPLEAFLDGRFVIVRLFPGRDRLVGPVMDPTQPAEADSRGGARDPDQAPEPPPPPSGKQIGLLTLILR